MLAPSLTSSDAWLKESFEMAENKTKPTSASVDDYLASKLGKHKMGKSCLYFKRLADLDKTLIAAQADRLRAGSPRCP
jgi:hypothetical protein